MRGGGGGAPSPLKFSTISSFHAWNENEILQRERVDDGMDQKCTLHGDIELSIIYSCI